MNFVNSFNIGGVDASQIPCIKGSGAPNSAIEGAVGCLYMDTDTGDMYKCTAAADGTYTWEKFGGSTGDIEGFPAFEKIGGEEYNEITKAVEVSTEAELRAYNGNAILKGYIHAGGGLQADADNAVLKIPVQAGDVIRDKLVTYWQIPGYTTSIHYAFFYNESDTEISRLGIRFVTNDLGVSNYEDIRANGITVPDGSSYVIINMKSQYKLQDATKGRNGLTANIITKNADASLTAYDGLSAAPDYIGVSNNGGETYYQAIDDIRIARYEEALGDIGTALDSIIAAQEGLIGGDAE